MSAAAPLVFAPLIAEYGARAALWLALAAGLGALGCALALWTAFMPKSTR